MSGHDSSVLLASDLRLVLMTSRICFVLLMLLAAAPAPAQPALVFDDFAYATAEWAGLDGQPADAEALYGRNRWCLDLDCRRTTLTRAWYRYLWPELFFSGHNPKSSLTMTPGGWLRFGLAAGRYRGDHAETPQQIASGFTARTGTWAARVRFGDLRRVPARRAEIIQAFWTLSPHSSLVETPEGLRKAWAEQDHEFNNFFHFHERLARVADQTGFLEGPRTGHVPWPLRAPAPPGAKQPAPAYSCHLRARPSAPALLAEPGACHARLAAGAAVMLLIQNDGTRVRFAVIGEDGFEMDSGWFEGAVPSQPMMAMFSQHLFVPKNRSDVPLPVPLTMEVDWFYYTPEATREAAAIRADVDRLRARGLVRLNTVAGLDLARPYTAGADCDAASFEAFCHSKLRAHHRLAVMLDAPARVAAGEAAAVVARLPARGGDYRLRWRYRYHFPGGRVGGWMHPDAGYFRLDVPMAPGAEAVEVGISVQEHRYLGPGRFEPAGPVVSATARIRRAGS